MKSSPCFFAAATMLVAAMAWSTAHAQSIQRVNPEQIGQYWIVDSTHVDVTLPYTGVNLSKPGCVAVSFVIGSNGATQQVQAARVVPQSDLGPSAVSMIQSMHYRPASGNAAQQPIATYLIVPFNMPSEEPGMSDAQRRHVAAERTHYLQACVLPGYAKD